MKKKAGKASPSSQTQAADIAAKLAERLKGKNVPSALLARIASSLQSKLPQPEAQLDLRKDVEAVRKMLAEAVSAYAAKHQAARTAKKHPPVTRIDLIFSLGDSESTPWVHLHFDTKPGGAPDGDPTHPDFAKLTRKAWLAAVQKNADGQLIEVIKPDGTAHRCRGDQLHEMIGQFLVDILLEARAKGTFSKLPKDKHCEMGVEDPGTGAFGWPAYKERSTSLVK